MKSIHWFRRSLAVGMLLLFVGFYVDVHFFAHSHIINGVTIVHSHVHNQHHHDTAAGGHTASEKTLIANIVGQFLFTGDAEPSDLKAAFRLVLALGVEQEPRTLSPVLSCPLLRAPPVLVS